MLDYVSRMRERLHAACVLAQESLSSAQKRMKGRYDKKAVSRSFNPGDQVLVLFSIPGSFMSARFSGPYVVARKISDTNYVVKTPERRRSSRMCHVNMLQAYYVRDSPDSSPDAPVQAIFSSVAAVVLEQPGLEDKEDGLELRHTLQQCERCCNSKMLTRLPSQMEHVGSDQKKGLILLINRFLSVFQDVPSRTSVLEHDVDVGKAVPIRQHSYRANSKKREILRS